MGKKEKKMRGGLGLGLALIKSDAVSREYSTLIVVKQSKPDSTRTKP